MPKGFFYLISAQFASGLADNALLILGIAFLAEQGYPGWWAPLLKFSFTLSYVFLAPLMGPLADAFSKANTVLLTSLVQNPEWLVIDEIGKLELKGMGFHDVLQEIIPVYQKPGNKKKLLLVIRNSLLEEVISFFKIADPQIIDSLS